jgi:hypothetical protein
MQEQPGADFVPRAGSIPPERTEPAAAEVWSFVRVDPCCSSRNVFLDVALDLTEIVRMNRSGEISGGLAFLDSPHR